MINQYQTLTEKAFLLFFKLSSDRFLKKVIQNLERNSWVLKIAESFFSIAETFGSLDSRLARMPLCVDVLGEYAHSKTDAIDYLRAVLELADCCPAGSHIAIKLSGLWPFCFSTSLDPHILELLETLVVRNSGKNVVTVFDAEDRLTNERVFHVISNLPQKSSVGLCVQAYWRNILSIKPKIELLAQRFSMFSLRIVKGAYYDREKKTTILSNSNRSITSTIEETEENLAKLLETFSKLRIQVAVGTHNIDTIKTVLHKHPNTEIQTLLGIGTGLALWLQDLGYRARIYAPISSKNSAPFLVRRFKENTNVSKAYSLLAAASFNDHHLNEFLKNSS